MLRLLTCYNPKSPVAIGERYGFQLWDSAYGYEYLTGGAGVALSASLVHKMIEPGGCNCPSPTTPDDMYLFGICLARMKVQVIHSPMLHQVCFTKLFILFKIIISVNNKSVISKCNIFITGSSFGLCNCLSCFTRAYIIP